MTSNILRSADYIESNSQAVVVRPTFFPKQFVVFQVQFEVLFELFPNIEKNLKRDNTVNIVEHRERFDILLLVID